VATKAGDLWFIHIKKNGGTSISFWIEDNIGIDNPEDHIGEPEDKSFKWRVSRHDHAYILPEGSKYFLVCRNPYARLLSLYFFEFRVSKASFNADKTRRIGASFNGVRGRNKRNKLPPDKLFGGTYGETFDKWVRGLDRTLHDLQGRPRSTCSSYEKNVLDDLRQFEELQVDYVDMDNPPTYILRFENLEEDFKVIQKHYNNYAPLAKMNPSVYGKFSPKGNRWNEFSYAEFYDDKLQEFVYNNYRRDFEYFGYSKELPNV
jgi:hypothetical protein